MLPDRVSNPGPLTYESGALPIALRGPARWADDNEIKAVCNETPFMVEKISPQAGLKLGATRSVGQRLTHLATEAPI